MPAKNVIDGKSLTVLTIAIPLIRNSNPASPVSKTDAHIRIRFGKSTQPFFSALKDKVNRYFESDSISKSGTFPLYIKALFFISTYFISYFVLLFVHPEHWLALLICAYMGVAAAAIGFNIMHDGAHGSFSDKKWLNVLAAYTINLLGGDAVLWKNKHNIIHHTYTNLEGHDQDIAQLPVLRLSTLQKKYYLHRYQHLYCFLVYGLSSLLWVFVLDFIKYFQGKVGNFRINNMETMDHLIFWFSKIVYFSFSYLCPLWYGDGWRHLQAFLFFILYWD